MRMPGSTRLAGRNKQKPADRIFPGESADAARLPGLPPPGVRRTCWSFSHEKRPAPSLAFARALTSATAVPGCQGSAWACAPGLSRHAGGWGWSRIRRCAEPSSRCGAVRIYRALSGSAAARRAPECRPVELRRKPSSGSGRPTSSSDSSSPAPMVYSRALRAGVPAVPGPRPRALAGGAGDPGRAPWAARRRVIRRDLAPAARFGVDPRSMR